MINQIDTIIEDVLQKHQLLNLKIQIAKRNALLDGLHFVYGKNLTPGEE